MNRHLLQHPTLFQNTHSSNQVSAGKFPKIGLFYNESEGSESKSAGFINRRFFQLAKKRRTMEKKKDRKRRHCYTRLLHTKPFLNFNIYNDLPTTIHYCWKHVTSASNCSPFLMQSYTKAFKKHRKAWHCWPSIHYPHHLSVIQSWRGICFRANAETNDSHSHL